MTPNIEPDIEKGALPNDVPHTVPQSRQTSMSLTSLLSSSKTLIGGQITGNNKLTWFCSSKPKPKRETTVRSLQDMLPGYQKFATFIDSDETFMLFRRFGYVQTRLLLEKQDVLRGLEQELDRYDGGNQDRNQQYLTMRDRRPADRAVYQDLFTRLETTYLEYAQLVNAAKTFVAMNRPSKADWRSVDNYLFTNKPLKKVEMNFISCKEDLITLRPGREHAWLDIGVENALRWLHKYLYLPEFIFCSEESKRKIDGSLFFYPEKSKINNIVVTIIILMIVALLVGPIYILYRMVNSGSKVHDAVCIGTLLAFTLAFSAVLSLFTRAKRHEILGAAAAYCAVLVVFLGNVNTTAKVS